MKAKAEPFGKGGPFGAPGGPFGGEGPFGGPGGPGKMADHQGSPFEGTGGPFGKPGGPKGNGNPDKGKGPNLPPEIDPDQEFLVDEGSGAFSDGDSIAATDPNPSEGDANPSNLTLFGSELYFTANDGETGTELWKQAADGGILQVADLDPGAGSSSPGELVVVGDALYFRATTPGFGQELWRVTATGDVELVRDIETTPNGSSPEELFALEPDTSTSTAVPDSLAPSTSAALMGSDTGAGGDDLDWMM